MQPHRDAPVFEGGGDEAAEGERCHDAQREGEQGVRPRQHRVHRDRVRGPGSARTPRTPLRPRFGPVRSAPPPPPQPRLPSGLPARVRARACLRTHPSVGGPAPEGRDWAACPPPAACRRQPAASLGAGPPRKAGPPPRSRPRLGRRPARPPLSGLRSGGLRLRLPGC